MRARRRREPDGPHRRPSGVQTETAVRRFARHRNSTARRPRPRLNAVKRHRPADPSDRSRRLRPFARLAGLAALATLVAGTSGCGALLLVGGAGTSAIAFATGELRSTEKSALAELDAACAAAVDVLGYDEVETERTADQIGLPRHDHAAGDPAQRAREPGLVHAVHALPGRDRPGPARGAAQLPDDGRADLTGLPLANASLLDEAPPPPRR
jgi:hypothetical protein